MHGTLKYCIIYTKVAQTVSVPSYGGSWTNRYNSQFFLLLDLRYIGGGGWLKKSEYRHMGEVV